MAAGKLPRPGTEYGPCLKPCNHTDCKKTLEMARSECKYCRAEIGYNRRFFIIEHHMGSDILAHESCAEEEQDRLKELTDYHKKTAMNKAAQQLGRKAKGVPKTYSSDQIAVLTKRLEAARKKRWPKKKSKNKPCITEAVV